MGLNKPERHCSKGQQQEQDHSKLVLAVDTFASACLSLDMGELEWHKVLVLSSK